MVTTVKQIRPAAWGQIQDDGAAGIRDRQIRHGIIPAGLAMIGELEVDGCAGDAVEGAGTSAEKLIKRGVWSAGRNTCIPTGGFLKGSHVEFIATVPVEFEVIRPDGRVAVQLKTMSDTHAVQEEAAAASHSAFGDRPGDERSGSSE